MRSSLSCSHVLLHEFDLATSDPGPRVARDLAHEAVLRWPGLVGLGVVPQTQIILLGVDHHGAPNNGAELLMLKQFHLVVRHAPLRVPLRVGGDVAQPAHVPNLVLRGAMVQAQGVPMRPGGLAAVGEVGLLVHMEAVLGARLAKILDVPGDSDGVSVGLLEGHDACAGLVRLSSITRLAIRPNNARRFQREGAHGLAVSSVLFWLVLEFFSAVLPLLADTRGTRLTMAVEPSVHVTWAQTQCALSMRSVHLNSYLNWILWRFGHRFF